ncbi:hypothetical protein HY640_04680 [Candidatus Woesearchaeota archaeon]|nr:hypothetical protein [Candidatus Woesearchaeota archaeon]
MRKADLSIDSLLGIFLGVIGIALLLLFFSTMFPGFSKSVYCQTLFHIHSSSFVPSQVRQDASYCGSKGYLASSLVRLSPEVVQSFSDGRRLQAADFSSSDQASYELVLFKDAKVTSASMELASDSGFAGSDVSVSVGSGQERRFRLGSSGSYSLNGFGQDIQSFLSGCPDSYNLACSVPVSVKSSRAEGKSIKVSIKVEFSRCYSAQELVGASVACWDKSREAQFSKDLKCSVVSVHDECPALSIDEAAATLFLVNERLCDVLPNKDFGCGSYDYLDWRLSRVVPGSNIFIRFDSGTKKVVVE